MPDLRAWARALRRDGYGSILPDAIHACLGTPRPWPPWSPLTRSPPSISFPDFIPVLGSLDDVILVPLGILLAIRLIPPTILAEHRSAAARPQGRPVSVIAAGAVAASWIGAAALSAWLAYRHFGR
jgi:hypothetical protein